MKRALRLRRGEDIRRVFREGKSWANRLLVLYALPSSGANHRCAFIAGRRVGNAVVRNRIRRRLREAVRQRLAAVEGAWDLVFVARKSTARADFLQCTEAVDDLLRRANLLRNPRK
jgi:ribonuclease P protein component